MPDIYKYWWKGYIKIKYGTITNSSYQKLLGILSDNKYFFDEHVTYYAQNPHRS